MIAGSATISGANPLFINAERDINSIIYQSGEAVNVNFKALVEHVAVEGLHNSAELSESPICSPGSRVAVLDEVYRWAAGPEDITRIQWIYGTERSGKSTLLHTVARMLELHKLLLATFFFHRTAARRNNANYIIPTIAYQISYFIPIRRHIEHAIGKDPLIFSKSLEAQAQTLIVGPITQAHQEKAISGQHPRIIIVDGLNECEGEGKQQRLLKILKMVVKVPIPIAFLVASRPESHILITFDSDLGEASTRLALKDTDEADDDIPNSENFCEICKCHPASQLPGPRPLSSGTTAPTEEGPSEAANLAPPPHPESLESQISPPTEVEFSQETEQTAPQTTSATAAVHVEGVLSTAPVCSGEDGKEASNQVSDTITSLDPETLLPPPDRVSPDEGPRIEADPNPITEVGEKLITYPKTTARETIIEDLVQLPAIIASIESDFANVAEEMTKLDQRNILSVKFAPEWKAIHDKFTGLVLNSQVQANDISNKISELTDIKIPMLELPIDQMSVEAKNGSLTKYIQSLETFKSDAVKNCEEFLSLQQDVVVFRGSLNDTIKNNKELVEKGFELIDKKIMELERALGKVSNIFRKSWDAFKTIFTRIDTGGANPLPRIAHQDIMEIVVSSLTSVHPKSHLKGGDAARKNQLSALQLAREKKDDILKEFSDAGEDIARLDPTFEQMAHKICAIQLIWHLLLQDCQLLLSKLSSSNDTDYVQAVKGAYTILKRHLECYALSP